MRQGWLAAGAAGESDAQYDVGLSESSRVYSNHCAKAIENRKCNGLDRRAVSSANNRCREW